MGVGLQRCAHVLCMSCAHVTSYHCWGLGDMLCGHSSLVCPVFGFFFILSASLSWHYGRGCSALGIFWGTCCFTHHCCLIWLGPYWSSRLLWALLTTLSPYRWAGCFSRRSLGIGSGHIPLGWFGIRPALLSQSIQVSMLGHVVGYLPVALSMLFLSVGIVVLGS